MVKTVRQSNPGGCEIFRTRPDRPWGPPSLLYNGYEIFHGNKAAGAWRQAPTPSSAEVEERASTLPLGLLGLFQGELYFTVPLLYGPAFMYV